LLQVHYLSSGILPCDVKDLKPIKLGLQKDFGFLASSNNDTLRVYSTHKLK